MKNSTHVSLPDDDYAALKALADEEDRTIPEQARHMLRKDIHFERAIRARANVDPLPDGVPPGLLNDGECDDSTQPEPHGHAIGRMAVSDPLDASVISQGTHKEPLPG